MSTLTNELMLEGALPVLNDSMAQALVKDIPHRTAPENRSATHRVIVAKYSGW